MCPADAAASHLKLSIGEPLGGFYCEAATRKAVFTHD